LIFIATTGCSADEHADADAPDRPDLETGSDTEDAESLPEPDAIADSAARARIELLTNDAIESLERAADFLAEQSSFSVVADVSFDVLQSDGRLLEFGSRREITLRRPDRFRMREARRDGDTRTVYFDGTTLSMDLPGHEAFVQIEKPGTLYAALEHLTEEVGAPVPLAELLSEDFAARLADGITSGYAVGPATVGGRLCEHVALRLPEVDIQLWIEDGDRPVIARIVISYKHEEGNPQFRATLNDWNLEAETPDSVFQFEPAEGSEHLVVGSLAASRCMGTAARRRPAATTSRDA
jgi:hypothetical protein